MYVAKSSVVIACYHTIVTVGIGSGSDVCTLDSQVLDRAFELLEEGGAQAAECMAVEVKCQGVAGIKISTQAYGCPFCTGEIDIGFYIDGDAGFLVGDLLDILNHIVELCCITDCVNSVDG